MVTLSANHVAKRFGGLYALADLTVEIDTAAVTGLIGPNGSGKTTLVNIMSGFDSPTSGHIYLDQKKITNISPDRLVEMGIVRTFQHPRPFKGLSVLENVLVASLRSEKDLRQAKKKALEALRKAGLERFQDNLISDVNTTTAKLVALAASLAAQPRFIMIDEGAAGLSTSESELFVKLLGDIHGEGIGLLVVEHVMRVISAVCDEVIVLDHGVKIAQGTPQEVMRSEQVIGAYLGRGYASRA